MPRGQELGVHIGTTDAKEEKRSKSARFTKCQPRGADFLRRKRRRKKQKRSLYELKEIEKKQKEAKVLALRTQRNRKEAQRSKSARFKNAKEAKVLALRNRLRKSGRRACKKCSTQRTRTHRKYCHTELVYLVPQAHQNIYDFGRDRRRLRRAGWQGSGFQSGFSAKWTHVFGHVPRYKADSGGPGEPSGATRDPRGRPGRPPDCPDGRRTAPTHVPAWEKGYSCCTRPGAC